MSDKINFKLFKPFGSTVAKAVMPLGLMKDFQDDLKQIRQDKEKQKNHDWSKKLVGHVDSEYLISPEIMQKWKQKFFDPIINTYVKNHIEHKIKSILINSAWYVISKPAFKDVFAIHPYFFALLISSNFLYTPSGFDLINLILILKFSFFKINLT